MCAYNEPSTSPGLVSMNVLAAEGFELLQGWTLAELFNHHSRLD